MTSAERHRIPRFPRGSTLRCTRCGREGSVGVVTGHTAKSRDCRGAAVVMIAPPPGIKHVAVPVHQARARPVIEPLPPLPPEPELVEALPPSPPPDDDPPEPDDEDDEEIEVDETRGRTAAPPRRPRLGRRPILRPGAPGAARLEEPAPTVAKIEIELWVSNAARFDAVRYDPEFAFDGTLADFINEVLEVHFSDCLGMSLQMRRRRLEIA